MEDLFLFDKRHEQAATLLRPYQITAVHRVQRELDAAWRCLCIAATGVGKTEIIAELARHAAEGCVVCVPRDILVQQTAERLRGRGLDVSIEQGPMHGGHGVTVASYRSLISRRRYEKYLGRTQLVCVDEVHDNYSRRSMEMLEEFSDAGSRIVGFTASPERGSGDPLTKFYGKVAFSYGIREAIRDGWLVPPKLWLTVAENWDFSKFAEGTDEFDPVELDRILRREDSVQMVASLIAEHFEGECSVAFCHSVTQARRVHEVLARRGIEASIVWGEQDKHERKWEMGRFLSGKTKICLNVQVLTMGFDHDEIRKLFLCKPTKSRCRYVQQVGRGTRCLKGTTDDLPDAAQRRRAIAESAKPYFEVFDITDSSRSCDLITALDVFAPDGLPDEIVRRAKRKQRPKATLTEAELDALLAEEQRQLAREEEARYALEKERRERLLVDVGFGAYSRDAFAAAEMPVKARRGWRMLWGKHKRTHVADVPLDYLQWFATEYANHRNQPFILGVRREIARRKGK